MKKEELVRGLGLNAATMIVAGSMIGTGIFLKPASMAGQVFSPELLILVWVLAGIITFIGALVNAEIAGFIDATGGQYVYFREMYGDFVAYIYGWSILSVIQTGSQAAIAYGFAKYCNYFFNLPDAPHVIGNFSFTIPLVGEIKPFAEFGTKSIAIISIIFLTAVNYIGVIFGGVVQTVITWLKIAAIILLSFLLLFLGHGDVHNLSNGFAFPHTGGNIISAIGLALAGAFWAYDGWNNGTFVAGEVKNPQRNVPLSLLYGTALVMVVYVLMNVAFLYIFPVEQMKDIPLVGAAAAEKIFGATGATIISIVVIVSSFGALNGSILATARVQYAMAKSKLFFLSLGKVHPRFRTPHISLVVQGVWSAVLVLSGSFDTITDYVIFAAWLFYLLGAIGIFILRKKYKDAHRPYKVWGYPWVPLIFVAFSFLFLMNSLISDFQNSMMGTLLIASGLPFYWYWKKKAVPSEISEL
jgi:APA family basic amino acid/polyamine antiporter